MGCVNRALNVERRKSTGGPSPVEVSRMISERVKESELVRSWQMKRQERYAEAKSKTEQEIDRLLKKS